MPKYYICLDSYFSRFWKEILKAVKCSFTPVSFVHWHFKCITSPTTYVEVSRIWCIWETWSTVVGYPKVLLTFWVMHVKMSWIYGTFPTRTWSLIITQETERVTVFPPKKWPKLIMHKEVLKGSKGAKPQILSRSNQTQIKIKKQCSQLQVEMSFTWHVITTRLGKVLNN